MSTSSSSCSPPSSSSSSESLDDLKSQILSLAQDFRDPDVSDTEKSRIMPDVMALLSKMYAFYGTKQLSEEDDKLHLDFMKDIVKNVAHVWADDENMDEEDDEDVAETKQIELEIENSLWNNIYSQELFGEDIQKRGEFAAMAATMVIEKSGAFTGNSEEVIRRLKDSLKNT